ANRETVAAPGDLVLLAASEPFEMTLSKHHIRSWALPRAGLEPLLADPSVALNTFIPGASVLGGLLGSYLETVWHSFGQVDYDTAKAFDNHLQHLIAIVLGGKLCEMDEPWEKCAKSAVGL